MFGSLTGWHVVVIAVILFAVVFIGIAALVIVLIAKNGRRSTRSKSLGGYHAEWTFSRGGASEPTLPPPSNEQPPELRQDPAGAPPAA